MVTRLRSRKLRWCESCESKPARWLVAFIGLHTFIVCDRCTP